MRTRGADGLTNDRLWGERTAQRAVGRVYQVKPEPLWNTVIGLAS